MRYPTHFVINEPIHLNEEQIKIVELEDKEQIKELLTLRPQSLISCTCIIANRGNLELLKYLIWCEFIDKINIYSYLYNALQNNHKELISYLIWFIKDNKIDDKYQNTCALRYAVKSEDMSTIIDFLTKLKVSNYNYGISEARKLENSTLINYLEQMTKCKEEVKDGNKLGYVLIAIIIFLIVLISLIIKYR